MTAPIIITGTTATGRRFVQFWTETAKVAGMTVTQLMAEMNHGAPDVGAYPLLRMNEAIDPAWIDTVLAVFDAFRKGGTITPTHTVAWGYGGGAEFTPVAPVQADDAPLELDIEVTA